MKVITFKPRFAELVRTGAKTQTIRPPRKRPFIHGEIVSLRMWTGLPYRSPQIELGRGMIDDMMPITIEVSGNVEVNGLLITSKDKLAIAEADGFSNGEEFVDWFEQTHGLPFTGVLITWIPIKWEAK